MHCMKVYYGYTAIRDFSKFNFRQIRLVMETSKLPLNGQIRSLSHDVTTRRFIHDMTCKTGHENVTNDIIS